MRRLSHNKVCQSLFWYAISGRRASSTCKHMNMNSEPMLWLLLGWFANLMVMEMEIDAGIYEMYAEEIGCFCLKKGFDGTFKQRERDLVGTYGSRAGSFEFGKL